MGDTDPVDGTIPEATAYDLDGQLSRIDEVEDFLLGGRSAYNSSAMLGPPIHNLSDSTSPETMPHVPNVDNLDLSV